MRFFHLSDLHIGLRLYNRDLLEDQRYILDQIIKTARQEEPDAIVIAGDIYDRAVPSAEAVELFDYFVSGLTEHLPRCEIMMISGNHDSPARIDVYRRVLERQNIHMIGLPPMKADQYIEKVVLQDEYGSVSFFLLPFVKPSMVKAIVGTDENGNNASYDETLQRLFRREIEDGRLHPEERNVLVSHQFYLPQGEDAGNIERMESEIVTIGNIDQVSTRVLEPFDYAALGHIHKPMKAGRDCWRYCGTPLAYSVDERGQKKGILEVELKEKGEVSMQLLPLLPLRQVRVMEGTSQEVMQHPTDDYVRIVLTDPAYTPPAILEMLRRTFPHLLEIVRKIPDRMDYEAGTYAVRSGKTDPYDLCRDLIGERAKEEELALLREVINKVQGGQGQA